MDIIVCVHNAVDHVRRCLRALTRHTSGPQRLILVNDASDMRTTALLREFSARSGTCLVIENKVPQRYTRAANQGLRVSRADSVVLLNSDTIVTPGWLDGLSACASSGPRVGIVGPLSNAASWQSVPERFGDGDWMVNTLPSGMTADRMARVVADCSRRKFPQVPFVNGFCMLIRRQVITKIGLLDEGGFPEGYGEEIDYCLRAEDAGFASAVADCAYVFHAKSQSYGHAERRRLAGKANIVLQEKHGSQRLAESRRILRDQPVLAAMRDGVSRRLDEVISSKCVS